jgi:ComEC/Rec2-related protein
VSAEALRPRLAGEVVTVRGTLRPVKPGRPWLVARHISGDLSVLRVDSWRVGDPASRVANGLRRTLVAGAEPLHPRARALFTGLVIGDDREQPADLADAFRGAGLTHLLAVSGQNVAFALALAGPLVRRLRLWPRLGATLVVIGIFGVMTRFEPSVLRASAMAALAATLAMPGVPISRLRIVGLAVAALVLIDPLLVRSAGFQLSVCAAVAIVVLAPQLASALPGPAALREAAGVTLAAQLGVAPVLLATFGPVPVASLPANLLCVPVAGLVMIWGLTAGLVAGAAGAPVAELLHQPTRLALAWLELVAERTAHAPLGELHLHQVVVLAGGLAVMVLAVSRPRLRRLGGAVVVGAVLSAVVVAHAPAPLRDGLAPGVVRWHADGVDVVVLGGAGGRSTLSGRTVLESLRRAGVGTIELLVVADPSVPASVVALVRGAYPTGATHVGADGAATVELDALVVRIVAVPGRLVVDARPRGP